MYDVQLRFQGLLQSTQRPFVNLSLHRWERFAGALFCCCWQAVDWLLDFWTLFNRKYWKVFFCQTRLLFPFDRRKPSSGSSINLNCYMYVSHCFRDADSLKLFRGRLTTVCACRSTHQGSWEKAIKSRLTDLTPSPNTHTHTHTHTHTQSTKHKIMSICSWG